MEGAYIPLEAEGAHREHTFAFARVHREDAIVAVVSRLVLRLTRGAPRWPLGEDVWGDTRILLPAQVPGDVFRNLLTGEEVRSTADGNERNLALKEVLHTFPVAVLKRARAPRKEP